MELLDCRTSYVQAANFGGDLIDPSVIVIHSAEVPEVSSSAEGVANYFASGNVVASTHCTTDENSIVQSVPIDRICYGTGEGGANAFTIQTEQAGYAAQTRDEWLDVFSRATITNTAVFCKEVIVRRPKIRPVFLDANALRNGVRWGITSHGEIHAAWPQGDGRTDPGPNYPWDVLLAMVRDEPTKEDLERFFAMLAELEEAERFKGDDMLYMIEVTGVPAGQWSLFVANDGGLCTEIDPPLLTQLAGQKGKGVIHMQMPWNRFQKFQTQQAEIRSH
jgi:N-acetyl-anhydromuramyl-L-alanine amidase AmpD